MRLATHFAPFSTLYTHSSICGGLERDPNKLRGSTVCPKKCEGIDTKTNKQMNKQKTPKLDIYYIFNLFKVFFNTKTKYYVVKLNFFPCNFLFTLKLEKLDS